MSASLAPVLGNGSPGQPPRPIPAIDKRTIEREVNAALAMRRELRFVELRVHGRVALALARKYGQKDLAREILRIMAGGCFAAATEFHGMLALNLLREIPAPDRSLAAAEEHGRASPAAEH